MQEAPARLAIVTGAASGIGRAIAEQLIELGYRVAAVDQDEAALAETAAALGEHALPCPFDVTDRAGWEQLRSSLRAEHPQLDLLVNNAGAIDVGAFQETDLAGQRRVLDVNLWGTALGCHTMAPWLIESASASRPLPAGLPQRGIINTASIFAVLAPPGFAAYSASKAGVVGLSESLRGELAPYGLNVTVTLPGMTPTGLFRRVAAASPRIGEAVARQQAESELTPELVARATLRAASRGAPHAVIGRRARRFAWLKWLLPGTTLRRVAEQARGELGLSDRSGSVQD